MTVFSLFFPYCTFFFFSFFFSFTFKLSNLNLGGGFCTGCSKRSFSLFVWGLGLRGDVFRYLRARVLRGRVFRGRVFRVRVFVFVCLGSEYGYMLTKYVRT